jgi:hypothetical protein
MSMPQHPEPAKLVVGVFLKEQELLPGLVGELVAAFGALDMISSWMAFDFTSYYVREMGAPLWRRMLAFRPLIDQDQLVEIKLATNAMEQACARDGRRRVNIDPGYLLMERFVLATGKNYSHRIYLRRGIYADLTLIYQNGAFRTLPWTYPDYGGRAIGQFLKTVRRKYTADRKGSYLA